MTENCYTGREDRYQPGPSTFECPPLIVESALARLRAYPAVGRSGGAGFQIWAELEAHSPLGRRGLSLPQFMTRRQGESGGDSERGVFVELFFAACLLAARGGA